MADVVAACKMEGEDLFADNAEDEAEFKKAIGIRDEEAAAFAAEDRCNGIRRFGASLR